MTPMQFTRSVRSLSRLRQMARVLTRHGFGYVVTQVNLARFVPVWMLRRVPQRKREDEGLTAVGRRIARICIELGPTYVKLGQMLSTREDLLPAEIITELRTLQDDVPPFSTEDAMAVIQQDLGRPAHEAFASIDAEPIASGSIGQAYRAVGNDGTELIVKVQRPGIAETIELDMQLLAWLAEALETVMPELAVYRPATIVAELSDALSRELDYVNEAATTARFAAAFDDDPGVRCPRVFWNLCGPSVIAIERLPGENLSTILVRASQAVSPIDRSLVGKRLVEAYLKQIFEIGSFHTDAHPGNILVEAPANIGLIDFGQVGTISDEVMTQLVIIVYACVGREVELIVHVLDEMNALGPNTNHQDLQRALQVLLHKYYGLSLRRIDLGAALNEFTSVIRTHDVTIPREVFLLLKAISMVTTLATQLAPDIDLVSLLQPRLKSLLRDRLTPKRLLRAGSMWSWQVLNVLRGAPLQIRDLLRRMSSGTWRLNLRHENLDRLTTELDRSSNRLSFAIVIAAIIVGSSVVVSTNTEFTIYDVDIKYFGLVGYIVAGIFGMALSWAIFRSGRLH